MEIRRIKPEERAAASKIQAVAFLFNRDFSGAESQPEEFQKGYETCRAAFNEEGKMCACFESIPYQVRFDGHTVNMAGIGGVATLPEERRRGYIRELFRFSFEEMREKNQIFSYLYPFSHPYYRMFGYEFNLTQQRVSIPFSAFASFPKTGHIHFHQPGEDRTPMEGLYNQFIQDKNLAVVRDQRLWDRWLEKDPYKDNSFAYIWSSKDGHPEAYLLFDVKKKEHFRNDMMVKELIWLNYEALAGVFGFMNQFASKFDQFVWDAPDPMSLHLLFPEPYNVSKQIVTAGMNRIVDLEKVLSLMKTPEEPGQMVLQVEDTFLDWNRGTYAVAWDKGEIEVVRRDLPPDLSCDIQTLSQLVTGFATIQELQFAKRLKVHSSLSVLSSVFKKKPLYLVDKF